MIGCFVSVFHSHLLAKRCNLEQKKRVIPEQIALLKAYQIGYNKGIKLCSVVFKLYAL